MGRGAADIAQVIPEVKEHVPGLCIPPALAPEHARFRFFASVTTFFANVAMGSPLVLVLDDLQWADTPSLLLLQFLARQLTALRVMVVGTYRDMAWPASHPLRTMLGAVAHELVVSSLVLQGLSEQAVARCLEQTIGVATDSRAGDGRVSTYRGASVLSHRSPPLTAYCRDAHRAVPGPGRPEMPVPQRVRDVVIRRLQALSADCQQFLSVAAVVGHNFRLPVVVAVAAQAHPPLQQALLDLLDEALAARLIAEVPRSPGHYSFAHALVRETLYEELPVRRRVHLHQQRRRGPGTTVPAPPGAVPQ